MMMAVETMRQWDMRKIVTGLQKMHKEHDQPEKLLKIDFYSETTSTKAIQHNFVQIDKWKYQMLIWTHNLWQISNLNKLYTTESIHL